MLKIIWVKDSVVTQVAFKANFIQTLAAGDINHASTGWSQEHLSSAEAVVNFVIK